MTIECNTFKIRCPNNTCVVTWDGEEENIFRISSVVCFAEELFWDFVKMVETMKCNFTAFCGYINTQYKRNQSKKEFVTPKTFIKAFFSWASHQNTEFRIPCEWCGHTPKYLACDGTKIGITQKMTDFQPIESTDGEVQRTSHRKLDRCFFPTSDSPVTKSEIKLAKDNLRKKMSGETIAHEDLTLITKFIPEPCQSLLKRVTNENLPTDQLTSGRRLFYVLAFDAPIRALLPLRQLPLLKDMLLTDDVVGFLKHDMVNPVLRNILISFSTCGKSLDNDVKKLLAYLTHKTEQLHNEDLEPEEPIELLGIKFFCKLSKKHN